MTTLKNYLDRLQLSGAPAADEQGLKSLHERHLLTVPFENLDIRAGRPLSLDLHDVLEKIVGRRRGGFCYELNSAFAWLLREVGFEVSLLEARVINDSGEEGVPFDHLVLRVEGETPFLADVGFGRGFLLPIAWDHRDEVRERGDTWLLRDWQEGVELCIQDRRTMRFTPVYRVWQEARCLDDFAEAFLYHQQSAASPFTQELIASIAAPDGRIAIRGNELTITRNRRREVHVLDSEEVLARELRRYFGLSLADVQNEE